MNGLPGALNFSTTGLSASALIGCTGLPCASVGTCGFISAHTSFETVIALPLRSMLNAGDDVGLRADADRRAERLAREHVRAVELAGDHAIENDLPVGLRLERDVQAFVLEEALLVRDGERRHVGELDEAELELLFLGTLAGGDGVGEDKQARR